MTWAQAMYSEQADKHRIPAPKFEVGDEVWLLQKNLKKTRPSSKLVTVILAVTRFGPGSADYDYDDDDDRRSVS